MLKISNLYKAYSQNIKVLSNVNLEIQKGVFGLIGPNGFGKSIVMHMIAMLQKPGAGSIRFDDLSVLTQKQK